MLPRLRSVPGPSCLLPHFGSRGVEALERLQHHHPERHHAPADWVFAALGCQLWAWGCQPLAWRLGVSTYGMV
jgi:hypothetical protein